MSLLTDLARGGLMRIRDRLRQPSGKEVWLALAARFGHIEGEVDGQRTSDDTGTREWLLESRGDPRGFQRFKTEAAAAGRALNQVLQRRDDDDPIDVWLDAVLEFANPESDLVITGHDRHRGIGRSTRVMGMVDASGRLCAKLATEGNG